MAVLRHEPACRQRVYLGTGSRSRPRDNDFLHGRTPRGELSCGGQVLSRPPLSMAGSNKNVSAADGLVLLQP